MIIKLKKNEYHVYGYSRAGHQTSIIIDNLDIQFDCGYLDKKSCNITNKLISHGHLDHICSLPFDYNYRKLNKIAKDVKYILPKQCIKPYKMIVSAYSHMQCNKNSDNINLLEILKETTIITTEECINNKIHLTNQFYCSSFEMDHKIQSFGYIIFRKSKRLKESFRNLSKQEIINLKQNNIDITDDHYEPLIGYTGDTTINGVLKYDIFLNVPFLIMECTGFDLEDKENCLNGKHIHFDDIKENYDKFNNEKIMLFHFSQKYQDRSELIDYINNYDKIELFY